MTKNSNRTQITIVGGGPVGLFLAICLLKKGIGCKILEKRKNPVPDSRSLGIHPTSLELLDSLGIIQPFIDAGVKMKKGIARNEKKNIGEISFSLLQTSYPFILACPQFYTEKILRSELKKLNPDVLVTEAEFLNFEEDQKGITTIFRKNKQQHELRSNFIVGCDGKKSTVRNEASISFSGKLYPDTYIMGDFTDTTDFGEDAVVFLPKAGMVECFPLPNGMRRWVVKTPEYIQKPTQKVLADYIKERINYNLYDVQSTMLSSFGVQYLLADTFAKERVLLAGDAAHVVSPIGGQGMNLGWIGARLLANELCKINFTDNGETAIANLKNYTAIHQNIVRKAARRAELNMRLGRITSFPTLRNFIVKRMLNTPFRKKAAQLFAMQKLYP